MCFSHRRDGLVDVVLTRWAGLDRGAVRAVVAEGDVRADDDGRRIPERLAFLELRQLRIGPIDRLYSFSLDDLSIRLIHEVVRRVLPEMLLAVLPLVHRPRGLPRTEARDLRALDVTLERGIGRP